MAVDSINPASQKIPPPASQRPAPDSSTLKMEDFMQLLANQLQNQDMNSPMSNSEMMGQLTSMATVQAMNTFSELSSTQYALNLIGQSVKVTEINETTKKMEMKSGIVTGINLSNMTLYLKDNPKGYGLGNVMEVGTVPEEPKDEDGDGKPDVPKPDDPNKPEVPKPDDPNKPEVPKPDEPNKPDDSGDKTGKSVQRSGAAVPDGRAAALGARGAVPGSEAASGTVTTLPDGRASVPIGKTATSSRASVTDDKIAASSTEADVRATASRAATNKRTAAVSGRSTAAPGGRNDTPGMAQDKIDALTAQASRTIPADKAASLERDRQMRSRIQHIGPGSWD